MAYTRRSFLPEYLVRGTSPRVVKLNETWYHYCSVDRASVDNLIDASPVGSYFNQRFRSQGPVHGPFDCRVTLCRTIPDFT